MTKFFFVWCSNVLKKGFRMTVGSPGTTGNPHAGLSYQCMTGGSRGALVSSFPSKPCSGGLFTTHHFPPYVISPL